jgi:hypothetical protein
MGAARTGLSCTHPNYYRCSLPGLAEFAARCRGRADADHHRLQPSLVGADSSKRCTQSGVAASAAAPSGGNGSSEKMASTGS